ncbi:hypothetical protein GE09DRAFT_1231445 [Coniochaeta sp. 2T2.1]|nr:hypothetical protein GE09DRAFT_1231445 [Coniochaeta sp. 2T2.1]
MTTDDLTSDLLGIALSDSEDEAKECTQPTATTREERNAQTEEGFQKLRSTYRVKVENGEIYKSVSLPLAEPSKPACQEVVHAVEELYFFGRYEEALGFIRRVLGAEDEGGLDRDSTELMKYYEGRCDERIRLQAA